MTTEYTDIQIRAQQELVTVLDSLAKDAGVTRDQAASVLAALAIRQLQNDDAGDPWIDLIDQRPAPGHSYLVWCEGWSEPDVDWFGPLSDPDDHYQWVKHDGLVVKWQTLPAVPVTDE